MGQPGGSPAGQVGTGSVMRRMRILTVSAHYPPNFVSGGTLQPQRISQGLRARGHDVSVYAGWIGDRPPLESWADTDETGMPVRWIVSSPWIGWSGCGPCSCGCAGAKAMAGASRTGRAALTNAFHISAGRLPPVIASIGVPSSLPTRRRPRACRRSR